MKLVTASRLFLPPRGSMVAIAPVAWPLCGVSDAATSCEPGTGLGVQHGGRLGQVVGEQGLFHAAVRRDGPQALHVQRRLVHVFPAAVQHPAVRQHRRIELVDVVRRDAPQVAAVAADGVQRAHARVEAGHQRPRPRGDEHDPVVRQPSRLEVAVAVAVGDPPQVPAIEADLVHAGHAVRRSSWRRTRSAGRPRTDRGRGRPTRPASGWSCRRDGPDRPAGCRTSEADQANRSRRPDARGRSRRRCVRRNRDAV